MNFKIITIGKLRNQNLINEINELKKRIKRIEIIELKEFKDKNIEVIKNKECEIILNTISKSDYNILLWEFGKEFSTEKFYEKIKYINQTICFIITGAFGPNEELKKNVDLTLSLSQMTFTHEQVFYLLIEQIYRIECFEKNIPYTK